MLVTFQNKLHETTCRTIYNLSFFCIFLCSSHTFDQSHSLMEADCAHKLSGHPLYGTTEFETGMFRQQVRKTPFYKQYLHYKFLKLYELLMFLEYLVKLRYLDIIKMRKQNLPHFLNFFIITLGVLIFAGTFFREFRVFCQFSRN